jgi:hypothetical protein
MKIIAGLLFVALPGLAQGKLGPRLIALLQKQSPAHIPVWIFFVDRDESATHRSLNPEAFVSGRSLHRRSKTRAKHDLIDVSDLPVDEEFVSTLRGLPVSIRHRSKWFNAVSADISPAVLPLIIDLPFVRNVDLVAQRKRDRHHEIPPREVSTQDRKSMHGSRLDYGLSFDQLEQINVPVLHDSGFSAAGVLVGVFDNGFRLLEHEAFDSLRIVATYDFVDMKESVVPNNPSSSFGSHGINTLSAIAGFRQGELVGPAYGASYLLARTENDSSETPFEEDNWVAAMEWADSLGVDVTSTSLIYREYDSPFPGWTWQDMDGNTTLITRAADMAVAKGIIVVNAAGNFGESVVPGQNTLGAPADGDSVLTVGAVDEAGNRASFSSVGPTTSIPLRIKPDVMARGVNVRAASGVNSGTYINTGGTSLACPLAAGVAALLVEMFPNSGPTEIMDAMRTTASQAYSPDNLMGWGILDAAAAAASLGNPDSSLPPTSFMLKQNFPNPFNDQTWITLELPSPADVTLEVYNLLGQRIRSLTDGVLSIGVHTINWNGFSDTGKRVASGVYICRVRASFGESLYSNEKKLVLAR